MANLRDQLVSMGIDIDSMISDILPNLHPNYFDEESVEFNSYTVNTEDEYFLLPKDKSIIAIYNGVRGYIDGCECDIEDVLATEESISREELDNIDYARFGNRFICNSSDSPIKLKLHTVTKDTNTIIPEVLNAIYNIIYYIVLGDRNSIFNSFNRLSNVNKDISARYKSKNMPIKYTASSITPFAL